MVDRPVRVLLIEDLPVYELLLTRILQQTGCRIESANSLAGGMKLAAEQEFDAVLLDLGLPDSNGLNTFSEFHATHPSLPVIILSGLEDESLAARAVQLGAQDYLTKGNYLIQGDAGARLLMRSIHYAIERHNNQMALLLERDQLEQRIQERTHDLSQMNQQLRTLAARLVSAQEDEHRRISVELHDEAGQALTALKLMLSLMRSQAASDGSELERQLQDAVELVGVTMDRLRVLAHDLRPPSLDNVGLNQSLLDFCQRTSIRAKMDVEYYASHIDHLPDYVQISLYRVVQEALTNTVKHARASEARVELKCDAEGVFLSICDNGAGFSPGQSFRLGKNHGIGLIGMRERVEALGGAFELTSAPGEGTQVCVRIPLQESA
jgi:signal transduction histidine kinase